MSKISSKVDLRASSRRFIAGGHYGWYPRSVRPAFDSSGHGDAIGLTYKGRLHIGDEIISRPPSYQNESPAGYYPGGEVRMSLIPNGLAVDAPVTPTASQDESAAMAEYTIRRVLVKCKLVAVEDLMPGDILCFLPPSGIFRYLPVVTAQPIGVARRMIKAGEWVDYEAGQNTADIATKAVL